MSRNMYFINWSNNTSSISPQSIFYKTIVVKNTSFEWSKFPFIIQTTAYQNYFHQKLICSMYYRVKREVPLANNKRKKPQVLLCKAFESAQNVGVWILEEEDDKNPVKVWKEFEYHWNPAGRKEKFFISSRLELATANTISP